MADSLVGVLYEVARREGLVRTPELRFIEEAKGPLSRGAGMAANLIEELAAKEGRYHSGLVHHSACYLFAKGVEATILWGHTRDGHFSINFVPGDILALDPKPEVLAEFEDHVHEALSLAEPLHKAFERWLQNRLSDEKDEVDVGREISSFLFLVALVGMSFAIESDYHLLGVGRGYPFRHGYISTYPVQ